MYFKTLRINGVDYPMECVIDRESDPSVLTKGNVGQICRNTISGDYFRCEDISDEKYLWRKVDTDPANAVYKTVSGDPAVFDDSAGERRIRSAFSEFEILQNTHGYGKPWPAGGGKNRLDSSTVPDLNSYIKVSNGNVAQPIDNAVWRRTDYIPVTPGEELYFGEVSTTASSAGTAFYDSEKSYISGVNATILGSSGNVFTVPDGAAFMRHSFRIDEGYNEDWQNSVYIVLNADDHEFTPYSNICPVNGHTSAVIRRCARNLFTAFGVKENQKLNSDGTIENTERANDVTTGPNPILMWGTSLLLRSTGTSERNNIIRVVGYSKGGAAEELFYSANQPEGEFTAVIPTNGYGEFRAYSSGGIHSIELYDLDSVFEVEIDFPEAAGIVCAGTIDFVKGAITIRRAYKQFDGTETWTKGTTNGSMYFFCPIGGLNSGVDDSGICSHFVAADIRGVTSDIGQRVVNSSGGNFRLCVRPADYASATPETFKAWVAEQAQNGTPLQISWELSSELEYTLSPSVIFTLKGENSILCDCGPVTVEYVQDTESAIRDATKETFEKDDWTRTMIADDNPDYVATKNYPAGSYLRVGSKLYYTLAPIAEGEDILPDWINVREASVGEDLASAIKTLEANSNRLADLEGSTSEDIDALKRTVFSDLNDASIWENGGIHSGTGLNTTVGQEYTIRTKRTLPEGASKVLLTNDGWKYAIFLFGTSDAGIASDGISYIGWWDGTKIATTETTPYVTWMTEDVNLDVIREAASALGPVYFRIALRGVADTPQSYTPHTPADCAVLKIVGVNIQSDDFNNVDLWENGGIASANGLDSTTGMEYTIRSRVISNLVKTIRLVNASYRYIVFAYSSGLKFSDDTYIGIWNGSALEKTVVWMTRDTDLDAAREFGRQLDSPVDSMYFRIALRGVADTPQSYTPRTPADCVALRFDTVSRPGTDVTMTLAGVAADAKGVADYMKEMGIFHTRKSLTGRDNIDDIIEPGVYNIGSAFAAQPIGMYPGVDNPTGQNDLLGIPGLKPTAAQLLVFTSIAASGVPIIRQIYVYNSYVNSSSALTRTRNSAGEWSSWSSLASVATVLRNAFETDADNIVIPGTYTTVTGTPITNLPVDSAGVLMVFASNLYDSVNAKTGCVQIYASDNAIYHRRRITKGWTEWVKDTDDETKGMDSITGIPILALTAPAKDIPDMTKDYKITMEYNLFGQTGPCTVKWQGSSSTRYEKKNFTITLDDAVKYKDGSELSGFSNQSTYSIGDKIINNGRIYECKVPVETPGVWKPGYWTLIAKVVFEVGEYVKKGDSIWQCNTAITEAEPWTADHWTEITDLSPGRTTLIGDYNPKVGYAVGAITKFDGELYRSIAPTSGTNAEPEEWNYSKWIKITGKGMDAWMLDRYFMNRYYSTISTGAITKLDTSSRWGVQTKYCTKANYVDPTHLRNVVNARIWGEIVASRESRLGSGHGAPAELLAAPNYGAINGFPVLITINGQPQGLYTMNIPKDKWMMGMGKSNDEYIIGGEMNASPYCQWKSAFDDTVMDNLASWVPEINGSEKVYQVGDIVIYDNETVYRCKKQTDQRAEGTNPPVPPNAANYWEELFGIEYTKAETAESANAAFTSLNSAIASIVAAGDGWDENSEVTDKLDVDSVFDYFIFTLCINNNDALARNILYGSYDGTKWFMSAYDLDTTFGYNPYGNGMFSVSANGTGERCNFYKAAEMNRLAYLMKTYSSEKLKARYRQLRAGILSDAHVFERLCELAFFIPENAYRHDRSIWKNTQSTGVASISQFMEFYRMHCAYLDNEIENL